jgi:hypothetical protein
VQTGAFPPSHVQVDGQWQMSFGGPDPQPEMVPPHETPAVARHACVLPDGVQTEHASHVTPHAPQFPSSDRSVQVDPHETVPSFMHLPPQCVPGFFCVVQQLQDGWVMQSVGHSGSQTVSSYWHDVPSVGGVPASAAALVPPSPAAAGATPAILPLGPPSSLHAATVKAPTTKTQSHPHFDT